MKSGGGASGWGIGFIGVNDSETNKDETFIKIHLHFHSSSLLGILLSLNQKC